MAEKTDIERVAHLCRDYVEAGYPWSWTPDKVEAEWSDFIVTDGGFIKLRRLDPVVHVDLLCVEPEARGKGLGRKLMGIAEQVAQAAGLEGVALETLDPSFFQHLGYEVYTTIPGFYYGSKDGIVCLKLFQES